jgi:hypothetical protein
MRVRVGPEAAESHGILAGIDLVIPDTRIKKHDDRYVYHPSRGFIASLIVMDRTKRRCIGWINTETLGYANSREWEKATGYQWLGELLPRPRTRST